MDKKKAVIMAGLVVIFIAAIGAGLWSRGSADRAQEKLDLAVKYISENDFDKAILAYNDAIKIDPQQVKAYQGLAKVYTLQGKYDDAKAAYDKGTAAIAANEQNALKLGLAGMYIDQGKLPDAEKSFQEIIDSNQSCIEAYWGLAMAYQKQGDKTKAEAVLRQAVIKYPNDYRGYNTLALFLKQNNKADDAFNNLVKSLSIELNQQEAYLVLNDLYKGRWTELQTKLSAVSNQQISAMLEFYMYYASEDYSKAVDTFKTKLSGQSGNYKARILAAIAMFKTGEKSRAETLIKQVLNEKFNDWLLGDVALYHQVAGDNEKARLSAIKAVQVNGINLEAVALLQKLNTGDEKKYAAEFLLYNWKPVVMVKSELNNKAISAISYSLNNNTNDEVKLIQVDSGVKVSGYQDGNFSNGKPAYATHFTISREQLTPVELQSKVHYYYPTADNNPHDWNLKTMKSVVNYYMERNSCDLKTLDKDELQVTNDQKRYYLVVFLDKDYNILGCAKGEVEMTNRPAGRL
ncbi:MAG: tetratricopeptide repeat protein [Syntrophomonas sp.]